MPQTTPEIKVEAVGELGAEVVLARRHLRRRQAHCDELVASTGRTFVHPFDDQLVIAGQGTIGHEILRHRLGDVDAIFVPVGGGGLIAGIASYVKALRPAVAGDRRRARTRRTRCTSRSKPDAASCSIASASSPTASPCGRSAR